MNNRTPEKELTGSFEDTSDSAETLTDVTLTSSIEYTESVSSEYTEISITGHKYEDEWNQLYNVLDEDWEELSRRAVLGNLRASRFRSVCWRALLGVLPQETEIWQETLHKQRQRYLTLKRTLCSDPQVRNRLDDDPLSQSHQSIWHQHFCDQELCAVIRQDVVRTFPGLDFFRTDFIQETMVSILFCYAREHPVMCYRQGMHEILAPLLFVLHCDHQALLHSKEQTLISDIVADILNPDFLEADAFILFTQIMSGIESCYQINDLIPTSSGYFPASDAPNFLCDTHSRPENEVVAKLNWIKDNLLAVHDHQLMQHLQDLDIPLPLFGIRWLRLLFGREFPLQDLLVLWDAIFAEGDNFELVNFVVVAMLKAIRNPLLSGDYTSCLQILMKYPGTIDITYIIEHALHLMHPQKYSAPAMASFPILSQIKMGIDQMSINRKTQYSISKTTKLDSKPNALHVTLKEMDTAQKLKNMSSRNVSDDSNLSQTAKLIAGHGDVVNGISEGYTLDDFALLRSDVIHARNVMALSRMKLGQYLVILRRNIPHDCNHDTAQALDGIQEICSFLKCDIEPALEANEYDDKHVPIRRIKSPPNNLALKSNLSETNTKYVKPQTPVKRLTSKKDVQLTLFNQVHGIFGQQVSGAPSKDPLGSRSED